MRIMGRWMVIALCWFLAGCASEPVERSFDGVAANADLVEHSREFERAVIEVTEGVHVAIGYGLANSILIEGDDGVIVVDTMLSLEEGREVKAEFDRITDKPLKAIIYTHNHVDHTFGAGAFAAPGEVDVYAHETTASYMDRVLTVVRPIILRRSARMFGTYLSPEALINAGIGPHLALDENATFAPLRPTKTFSDRLEVTIAGIELELVLAPGETDDQIFVHLPEKGVLLPGDNFYRAFPNLYTIRGTPYRDVRDWYRSLDRMRARRPRFLVPSHSRPITGEEAIDRALTDYRDAIQYVHDQTVRGMNLGLTPDELDGFVRLPPHLASSPYLQEYYGKVSWSVRSIYDGYLGFFDGNSTHLHPLAPAVRAERMAALAGGEDGLLAAIESAADGGDRQWVLELTDHLLLLDPANATAKSLRVDALKALGEAEINANARHFYLTQALELRDGFEVKDRTRARPETVHAVPMAAIFESLAVGLDPVKSADIDQKAIFRFPDSGEVFSVHVRRGVAEIQPRAVEGADLEVEVDSRVWKEIAAGLRSPAAAFATGKVDVEGGTLELVGFLKLFQG